MTISFSKYSIRSLQEVLQFAKKKARIIKHGSIYRLHHSFATHLLEKGVDIKYTRDLSGNFYIKPTARYLHVKRAQLVNIESPLDVLMLKDKI